jgi:hypothetical protein
MTSRLHVVRAWFVPARSKVRLHLVALALLGLCLPVSSAHAHPGLDEGKRLISELEFESALAAFQGAIDSGELTRAELVDLLSERTLVLQALHRESELVQDFVWLAALAPEHILDMRAPPAMVAMWKSVRDQARGALGVKLSNDVSSGEYRLRAELTGTVPEGARARIAVRDATGKWEVTDSAERVGAVTDPIELDAYAQALGPGGLVVAEDGSADNPKHLVIDPRVAASAGLPGQNDDQHSRRKRRAWIIGSCAVAVAAAAAVTSFFLIQGKNDGEKAPTNLTPMVTF